MAEIKDFRKIQFGCMDASKEEREFPELLRDGYVNHDKVVERAFDKSTFLFLGYKGSGKSSLSEHLHLIQPEGVIVSQEGLKDFPFKTFFKIIPGDADIAVRAREAWRWLLAIKVLDKLISDPDAHSNSDTETEHFVNVFTQAGLFPLSSMASLVKKTSTVSFKATIKAFEFSVSQKRENADVSIAMATDYVIDLLASFKEGHQHIIVIDDLDDTLTKREEQYVSIAALINEVKTLNTFLSKNDVPVKIITLCRTDIFDRLPDPNKNKTRRDNSFSFTWYKEGISTPKDSPLIHLINKRARLVYPEVQDVFKEFFPREYDNKNIYNSLLDFTRHTPRDFIQLMNSIQMHCKGKKVTTQEIKEGIKDYSSDYFVTEIEDEMAGYIEFDKIKAILGVFSVLRKREFTFDEFLEYFKEIKELEDVDVNEAMRVLYDCSAIGNIYTYDGQTARYSFKYRNRLSAFSSKDKIQLHKGLWKALNVNF